MAAAGAVEVAGWSSSLAGTPSHMVEKVAAVAAGLDYLATSDQPSQERRTAAGPPDEGAHQRGPVLHGGGEAAA